MHSAQEVARGKYEEAEQLFTVTANETEKPEWRELAETLGFMCVKVEGREYSLSLALDEVKQKNTILKEQLALRAQSSLLFSIIITIMCGYTLLIAVGLSQGWIGDGDQTFITLGLLVVVLLVIGFFRQRHHYLWSDWGLTWKGGTQALVESVLFSLPWALGGIGLKGWLVHAPGSSLYGHPVFEFQTPLLELFMYALVSIVQEIVSRGFLQTATEKVLTGPYRSWVAIFISSIIFSVLHLHYSTDTMLATLFSGFFFGWLYHRHRTVVGVSVAHFLLGVLAWDVLHLIG